jgi:large subunit ribosomal protein L25
VAERTTITAERRAVLGKHVQKLRREGILPANVYGRGLESVPLQLDAREFTRVLRAGAARGMFELAISGEAQSRHVVLRSLSRKGGTGEPLHVDFYQVDLSRPVQTNVPIHLVGESPAVRDLAGTLVQSLEHVVVRCLPLEIPEMFEGDLSLLTGFGTSISVSDLKLIEGVDILTDPALTIATANPPRIRREDVEGEAEAETEPED